MRDGALPRRRVLTVRCNRGSTPRGFDADLVGDDLVDVLPFPGGALGGLSVLSAREVADRGAAFLEEAARQVRAGCGPLATVAGVSFLDGVDPWQDTAALARAEAERDAKAEAALSPLVGAQFADLHLGFAKSGRPTSTWKKGRGWPSTVTGWPVRTSLGTTWYCERYRGRGRHFLVARAGGGFTMCSGGPSDRPSALEELSAVEAARAVFDHVAGSTGALLVMRRSGEYGTDVDWCPLPRMMAELLNRP